VGRGLVLGLSTVLGDCSGDSTIVLPCSPEKSTRRCRAPGKPVTGGARVDSRLRRCDGIGLESLDVPPVDGGGVTDSVGDRGAGPVGVVARGPGPSPGTSKCCGYLGVGAIRSISGTSAPLNVSWFNGLRLSTSFMDTALALAEAPAVDRPA
jgi:hypothetical protein